MKITQFNQQNIQSLQREMKAALEAVMTKHGLVASPSQISWSSNTFKFKMEVSVVSEGGLVLDDEALMYNRVKDIYGFTPNLGDVVNIPGYGYYAIRGFATRKQRCPVIVENTALKKSLKLSIDTFRKCSVVSAAARQL